MIYARIMSWQRREALMTETLLEKREGKRPLVRYWRRWDDNINMGFKEV
jgi:hypothetical protein